MGHLWVTVRLLLGKKSASMIMYLKASPPLYFPSYIFTPSFTYILFFFPSGYSYTPFYFFFSVSVFFLPFFIFTFKCILSVGCISNGVDIYYLASFDIFYQQFLIIHNIFNLIKIFVIKLTSNCDVVMIKMLFFCKKKTKGKTIS